jgi:hypothetical protein
LCEESLKFVCPIPLSIPIKTQVDFICCWHVCNAPFAHILLHRITLLVVSVVGISGISSRHGQTLCLGLNVIST